VHISMALGRRNWNIVAGLSCLNGSFARDSLPCGRAAPERGRERGAARVVTARKGTRGGSDERNSSGPRLTFSCDACWRWRRRLSPTCERTRGRRSEGGGATRKKVYRLQRSEKLRFRSQHRRHSSLPPASPLSALSHASFLDRNRRNSRSARAAGGVLLFRSEHSSSIAVLSSLLMRTSLIFRAPSGYARGAFYADYARIIACARNGTREATLSQSTVTVTGTNGSRLLRGFTAINPLKPISDPIRCVKLIYVLRV